MIKMSDIKKVTIAWGIITFTAIGIAAIHDIYKERKVVKWEKQFRGNVLNAIDTVGGKFVLLQAEDILKKYKK
jgi:hypothetical protein